MDTKRFAVATLVGGIVLLATGYLIFDVAFANFYLANAGSATGVSRDSQLMWAVALGSCSYAALVVYALAHRTSTPTVAIGLKTGAIVGFLLWCAADFILYGISNVSNLTRVMVDPLLESVHGGLAGAAIAAVLARVPVSDPARHPVAGFGV